MQNKLVQNDIGEMEWENLDDMVCDIAKTFRYSQSMFGTFDLTAPDMPPAMQKQRAQRKRNEPGIEKQPLAVTQTGKEKGNKKLEVIFQQIMQVKMAVASEGKKCILIEIGFFVLVLELQEE